MKICDRSRIASRGAANSNRPAALMALLSGLFFLRVLGQLLVSRNRAKFLPPMEQWQSGFLPYPALLACQIAILTLQGTITAETWHRRGPFVAPMPRVGRALRIFSAVYFAAMVLRYVVSRHRHPERRWVGPTIPIVFHCLLATYLNLYSRIIAGRRPAEDRG